MSDAVNPGDPTIEIRPTFADPDLEEAFSRNGFVAVDLFGADEVRRLREEVVAHYPPTRGFATSVEIVDESYRTGVYRYLESVFAPKVEGLFVGHRMNLTAVAIKYPGDAGLKPLHQDWSFCDESRYRSVNVWVPLVDTTARNGTLVVLPGSHRVLERLRPAPRFPAAYRDPVDELSMDDMTSVDVKAGQALILDLALVHGSPPNRSDEPRPVIVGNFIPADSPISYYYCDEHDEVHHYDVGDVSFFQRFDFHRPPTELRDLGSVPFTPPSLDADAILAASAAVSSGGT